jgi:hypothetical protein
MFVRCKGCSYGVWALVEDRLVGMPLRMVGNSYTICAYGSGCNVLENVFDIELIEKCDPKKKENQ